MDSPVIRFSRLVFNLRAHRGHSLESAVRLARQSNERLCLDVMECIGLYTSSEPELAELQRQWK